MSKQGQNNTKIYFTRYSPVIPFMLKKIVQYNLSTSEEITVSCVMALKTFKPTQSSIATIINAPDTLVPESQEEQAGEQNKEEVSDTAEEKPITQEGPEGNGKDETQSISLISSCGSHILYCMQVFPEQGLVKQIELKAIMEGLSLKTTALELKKNLMVTLETNITPSPHPPNKTITINPIKFRTHQANGAPNSNPIGDIKKHDHRK